MSSWFSSQSIATSRGAATAAAVGAPSAAPERKYVVVTPKGDLQESSSGTLGSFLLGDPGPSIPGAPRVVNASLVAKTRGRGKQGRRSSRRAGNGSLAVTIVPALHVTTTIKKRFRWLVTGGTSSWQLVFTDTVLARLLVSQVTSTTARPIYGAMRLLRVTMYVPPSSAATSGPTSVFPYPTLEWLTAGTGAEDTKPDEVIPAVTDQAHTGIAVLVPNPRSTVGFWRTAPVGANLFMVSGASYAGETGTACVIDVDGEFTLPGHENQPGTITVTSITTGWAQPLISGSAASQAGPVGYPSYTP